MFETKNSSEAPVDDKSKIVKKKDAGKEKRRLQTNNVNIGRILHWAEVANASLAVGALNVVQAVHPAEWRGVDGFMLFQRILTRW